MNQEIEIEHLEVSDFKEDEMGRVCSTNGGDEESI
jgi:hypothetical protein